MLKSVVYYTDHQLPPDLAAVCGRQLLAAAGEAEVITVGLNAPVAFGRSLVHMDTRGILAMHRQILAGLEAAQGEYVFLCEHDVYYHLSHFDFVPPRPDTYYFNVHNYHVRWPDGYAVAWDNCQQVSGLCAARALVLDFYRQRVPQLETMGFNRHYEPGPKQSVGGRRVANWRSAGPNYDIRHSHNLTASKWSPADFRNAQYAAGWRTYDRAPGWDAVQIG